MDQIFFYCLDDSELMEFNSKSSGFRPDIYVGINNYFFQLVIYDIIRLSQDFYSELNTNDFFSIDPNIIIVNEVTLDCIKKTILRLYKQKYFDKVKPLTKGETEKLVLLPF